MTELTRPLFAYSGNKGKLLKNGLKRILGNPERLVDWGFGSGVVGLNIGEELIGFEYEPALINLFNHLDSVCEQAQHMHDTILNNSPDAKSAYYHIRNYYNNLRLADTLGNTRASALAILAHTSFNSLLRWNKKGEFNAPVGMKPFDITRYTDGFEALQQKLFGYEFHHSSEWNIAFPNLLASQKDTLFYFDPPYLLTCNPYSSPWGSRQEMSLYQLLLDVNDAGHRFAMSNVMMRNGEQHDMLASFCKREGFFVYEFSNHQYRNWSYSNQHVQSTKMLEVCITNYEVDNE